LIQLSEEENNTFFALEEDIRRGWLIDLTEDIWRRRIYHATHILLESSSPAFLFKSKENVETGVGILITIIQYIKTYM
jgi:hypothetical protein